MNEKVSILLRDFLGIAILAFSLFTIVSLATYSPADPSMNTSFSTQTKVINSGGLVGAYISDGLVQFFGSGAFFFPLITLMLGWAFVRGKEFRHWPLRLSSGVIFLIGLCALCSIQFNADPIFKHSAQVGGLTGETLGSFLVTWFSTVGATIFLTTMIFTALLAMTGTTVSSMLDLAGKLAGTGVGKLLRLIDDVKKIYKKWVDTVREASKAVKEKSEELFIFPDDLRYEPVSE